MRLAYSQEGTWIPHPTYAEGDESTFELVVAGRQLDDGDVAIMMVEAGGTEKAWDYYEAGAPKVTEEVIAEGLEASQDVDQGVDRACSASWSPKAGVHEPIAVRARGRLRRRTCSTR